MNTKLLKNIMLEKGITLKELSKKTKIAKVFLYLKITEKMEFTLGEIVKVANVLNLTEKMINQIFFDLKVS